MAVHRAAYSNDNIFRGSKDPVQDGAGEGRIETVRWGEAGENCIGHGLWDDD